MTVLVLILLVTPIAILVFMSSTFVAMIAPRRPAPGSIPPKRISIAPPPMQPAQNVTAAAPNKLRARQTLAMRRQLKSTGQCDSWPAPSEPGSARQEQRPRSERPGRRARRMSVRVWRPIKSA